MAKNRKCILCETVCISKQEMEEHMRSMLHHRELENLKGRDCGHECRVCKVTVVSLTDYASHISSPTHKQNVEDFERIPACKTSNEEYFDKALVELIKKRNEQIRKEKEATAAKLAQEEAERKRKEEFQLRLKETKERFQMELQQQSNLYGPQHGSWYKGNQYGPNPRHMQNVRPWQQSKWGKSSTWHAQDPPNFKNFNKIPPPWISNTGSSNGVYGCNNISQNVRPSLLGPPPPLFPSLPKFFTKGVNQFQNQATNEGGKQKHGPKSAENQNTGAENPNNKANKSFGSNPKFDKTCRWSPYHVNNKGSESMPNLVQKTPKSQQVEKAIKSGSYKLDKRNSSGESSNNSSRSSSLQRDGQKSTTINTTTATTTTTTTATPSPSTQKAKTPAQKAEMRPSVGTGPSGGAQVNKASSQNNEKLKTKTSLRGLSKSDRQLTETVKKVKQMEKRWSLNSLSNIEQKATQVLEQRQIGVNKENTVGENQAKPCIPTLSKPVKPSTDQSLQHLQVTTSVESSTSPITNQEGDKNKSSTEKEPFEDTFVQSTVKNDATKTSNPQTQSSKSKIDLPPLLKKDLTKHMIPNKAKIAPSLEPNLNIARRVRNLSGSKKNDSDKDSGLKPTVRQLISSSGSRRNVNWEQVYHEVRKKQDKGKGMPRFGIEMVPMDQEEHSQEEDDFALLQGFQWESLLDIQTSPTSRKRSLSESSVAPTPNHTPFLDNIVIKEPSQDTDILQEIEMGLCEAEDTPQMAVKARQRADSVAEEISSGTEMWDGQGTSKKRRAKDMPHPETSSLEHHTKRRKKSKKVAERSHIEELLAVSLHEDELSRSLLTLDTDLIKARAALEAAYMEVQRLMMAKQQMTTEMGTLRNKRIELLKGMQGSAEERKEERRDDSDLPFSSSVPFIADTPRCGTSPRASPPAPCVPFTPVAVKEEPRSPVHISPKQGSAVCAHSTTPELPSAASATEAAKYSLPSLKQRSELCQRHSDQERDEFGEPVDSKESLADLVQSMEKGIHASRGHAEPSTNDKMGSFVESTAAPSFETPSVPSGFNVPASPSELRSGKKTRKLKKRKLLKKAQSSELPESSDTEVDTEGSRPRCPRSRRRNSGGSQVSTSNQQTEEKEDNVQMEETEELHIEKKDPKPSKSSMKQPRVMLCPVTVKSELEKNAQGSSGPAQDPDSSKPEAQNVACFEVSSTSDMDVSPAPESDVQVSFTLPEVGKTSSDVSSDHGEDDIPTEGAFEGHVEAVNSMQIHDGLLYTSSGDRTVRAFDIVSHKCVAVFEGHTSKVNALLVSKAPRLPHRLYTGSSDLTIRCYSLTTQKFEEQFSLTDRVLCLHSRWKILYAGLGNGTVVSFKLKTNKQTDVFECHGPRAVSCLASSQEGARRLLLVGSYDNTISVRDAKNGLLLRTLEGHSKTVLCMKVVNDLVYSGSSDQCVYAHNIHSGQLVRVYKGHSHAVSVVCVQGKMMLTACLDKLIRVYDLQSHEQLQVYGGHKDMVMCMTTHKNMIYTGCYDGSVQAFKLNLMQNYRCQWHGCSMVFGVLDHLEHHLCHNHASQNLQTLRCRWKNCEEFFSSRISSKKLMLLHMQKHVAEESQVEP